MVSKNNIVGLILIVVAMAMPLRSLSQTIAGVTLNVKEEKASHVMTGYVGDVNGNVYVITDKDSTIREIVFIPIGDDGLMRTITDEELQGIIENIHVTLGIDKIDAFNSQDKLTILINKIEYEIFLKIMFNTNNALSL